MCNIRIIINTERTHTGFKRHLSFLKGKFWLTYTPGKTQEEDKNNIACENEKAVEKK